MIKIKFNPNSIFTLNISKISSFLGNSYNLDTGNRKVKEVFLFRSLVMESS